MTRRNISRWAFVGLRLALGFIFVYASLDKIAHPGAFAEIIYNYQIMPDFMINLSAIVLPWLELAIGALLIAGWFMPGATGLTFLLLLGFWASLLFNAARGLDVHCGCFSTQASDKLPMYWYVLRDSIFLLMGAALLALTVKKSKKDNLRENI